MYYLILQYIPQHSSHSMMLLLTLLPSLLLPLVTSAPSEGCGLPLHQLHPGKDHRLTVSVSEPGRPDIQRCGEQGAIS